MADKEKIVQIYEAMADITLTHLKKIKEAETVLDESDIRMVSTTLQLHNATVDHRQPELFPR